MAAQSGIAPTQDLLDTWTTALQDPATRLVKIAIQDEQLVPAGTFTTTSSDLDDSDAVERDFALFERPDIVEDKVPAYFVYRLTPPPSSTFLFTSYVPDHAPVRAKMLYASTRNTLVRALGDARLVESVFATAKADLTHAAYLSHVAHRAADAPLTSREQEMRDVRRAEAEASADGAGAGSEGRSALFGVGEGEGEGKGEGGEEGQGDEKLRGVLPWSDEAKEAVRALGDGGQGAEEDALVQLEIDPANETVILSPSQPTSLSSLPTSSPAYLLARHPALASSSPGALVLVYSCPAASPVRHRLLYSSAVVPLYRVAAERFAGVKVARKLETDSPSEITRAWLDAELGAASSSTDTPSASGAATPTQGPQQVQEDDKPKFARPARPGRRR
ncbi:uncharacterized protein RHOBADRAFT_49277 [Rhodotorula graminis WP1]|uniref:ADF-H domain-containing protein n=1 Tax=Rhodotorula graminis (strain WP1) TaxID=578459 RepID=A0A194SAG2_RHOGW|nr:uncharacterized protein RHOBADRAFT_49277 [Rhodotorula graminis WP1]KPV77597.1 hypothetical protein RHOBADRAFT_49277 [Rhodotorula graminis WP1]